MLLSRFPVVIVFMIVTKLGWEAVQDMVKFGIRVVKKGIMLYNT
jgi:hypothetical protein